MSLFHLVMVCFSHTQISWATWKQTCGGGSNVNLKKNRSCENPDRPHTCWISLKSWLTSIIPPSNSLMASARASMVSMSRWLVGSSRNSMWGFCHASQAKQTRHFWPSDRFRMGLTWKPYVHLQCAGTADANPRWVSTVPVVSPWDHSGRWSSSSPPSLWSQGNTSSCTPVETGRAPAAL